MKFIKISIYICIVFNTIVLMGQKKMKNVDLIAVSPYVSNQIEYLPSSAKSYLENKLDKIISANGLSSDIAYNDRFILTPNITVVNKNIVSGAPPKVVLVLDVSFYVGDGLTGIKFGSTSFETKGVGTNETKAYISAIKNIGNKNKKIKELLELSKNKILSYYNSSCKNLIKEADNFVNLNQFDEAIQVLISVPKESGKCYSSTSSRLKSIYKKKIDSECKALITKAENAWNFGLDFDAANKAGEFLSDIDPASACYKEAKKLFDLINKSLEKKEIRNWEFELKKQENINNYNLKAFEFRTKLNLARSGYYGYNTRKWW